jgi:hypothetical protein
VTVFLGWAVLALVVAQSTLNRHFLARELRRSYRTGPTYVTALVATSLIPALSAVLIGFALAKFGIRLLG